MGECCSKCKRIKKSSPNEEKNPIEKYTNEQIEENNKPKPLNKVNSVNPERPINTKLGQEENKQNQENIDKKENIIDLDKKENKHTDINNEDKDIKDLDISDLKFKRSPPIVQIRRLENKHKSQKSEDSTIINSNSNQDINWDNYFSKEEIEYYKKLYETESFDRPEIKQIKNYKKGELIGSGSFGRVYNGFDEEHGRLFAIKEVDMKKVKSIKYEIEIHSRLNNKNIVKYYGSEITDTHLHIFLEFCIGGSISKLLGIYKGFPENLIRKYTRQILEGLEYLHSHNVIHRGKKIKMLIDLKGANILVDRDGVCKLTDFGGSKIMTETLNLKKKDSFKGTPNWMAPESVKHLEYSRFSDIWGLGCTIIEMAKGEPPFGEISNPLSTLLYLYNLSKPPEVPNHLSYTCKDFILSCLKINPSERLNVCKLLHHPFITGDNLFTFNSTPTSNTHASIFNTHREKKENKLKKETESLRQFGTYNTNTDKATYNTNVDKLSKPKIVKKSSLESAGDSISLFFTNIENNNRDSISKNINKKTEKVPDINLETDIKIEFFSQDAFINNKDAGNNKILPSHEKEFDSKSKLNNKKK